MYTKLAEAAEPVRCEDDRHLRFIGEAAFQEFLSAICPLSRVRSTYPRGDKVIGQHQG